MGLSRRQFLQSTVAAGVLTSVGLGKPRRAQAWAEADPWQFAVMADTQWTVDDDGRNPYSVATDIIQQLTKPFIEHRVQFVLQVGDLTDQGYSTTFTSNLLTKKGGYKGTNLQAIDTRAIFAQPLYQAGIGFFPVRGNHEDLQSTAVEFARVFPQTNVTSGGLQNATPGDVFTLPNPDAAGMPFPTPSGHPFRLGTNFDAPPITGLAGLSYAFDFGSARFVLIDQFTRTDGTNYQGAPNAQSPSNNLLDQLGWVDATLTNTPRGGHAFVFSHKNLIGENHTDVVFGADPSANLAAQQTFFSRLATHGVRYYLGGHDHLHQRSRIVSPNATPTVHELICASDSSKFYIPQGNALLPGSVNNDGKYDVLGNGVNNGPRETSLAQELYEVGYYLVTVDGPRVTIDYYAALNTGAAFNKDSGEFLIYTTPQLTFTKRETFGYSLNGQEFLVPEGKAYTSVYDQFEHTEARLLSGTNTSTTTDGSGRNLTQAVNTGWTSGKGVDALASDILTLWGLANQLGGEKTDTYTLAMTYEARQGRPQGLGLVTRDARGEWVVAVSRNVGGTPQFVQGAWEPRYDLGTFGVDPDANTAWAVLNRAGDFAVGRIRDLA